MVVKSRIKPEILEWVIDESGYALPDLAAAAKVSVSELEAWTSGDEVAPRGKVSVILRKLHRSPDIVYLDEVPEEARLKAHFRTMKVGGGKVPVSPDEVRAIREAHYVQYMMSDIIRRSEVAPSDSLQQLKLGNLPTVESQGRMLRDWVESGAAYRRGRSFEEWRSLIERRSIFVMMMDIKRPKDWADSPRDDPSKLRGFSLPDEFAPLIVVCTDHLSAKTFTLFHELAHLGLSDEPTGSCHVPIEAADENERLCDRIAGSALLPLNELRAFIDANGLHGNPDLMVKRVSGEFQVSMRAAAIAIENGLGHRGIYRRTASMCMYRDRTPRNRSGRGPGFGRVDLRLRRYGRGLVRTLLQLYADGSVTDRHLCRILKVKRDEVLDVADRVGVNIPT